MEYDYRKTFHASTVAKKISLFNVPALRPIPTHFTNLFSELQPVCFTLLWMYYTEYGIPIRKFQEFYLHLLLWTTNFNIIFIKIVSFLLNKGREFLKNYDRINMWWPEFSENNYRISANSFPPLNSFLFCENLYCNWRLKHWGLLGYIKLTNTLGQKHWTRYGAIHE